jgi:fatty-acyl-CoA synthase
MRVPLLVNDFLRRAARLYPTKTAIVDGKDRYSYADYAARVEGFARALTGLGLKQGDRVCMLSPNSHFFLESFYATSQLGVILVPLNYRLVPEDHRYIIDHAGVKAVIADYDHTHLVDEIREGLPSVEHFIVAQDDSKVLDDWRDWNTLVTEYSDTALPDVVIDEDDLVSINYTSGTTARPKGVMLTHRNCYMNAYSLIAHLRVSHDDVELWTLPMFHCNGWGGVYALTAMGGTHVVLRTVDAAEIYRLISAEQVTFACMAPTVLRTILDFPHQDQYEISTQPRFVVAGAPPPGGLYSAHGAGAGLGVPADLWPHGDCASVDR